MPLRFRFVECGRALTVSRSNGREKKHRKTKNGDTSQQHSGKHTSKIFMSTLCVQTPLLTEGVLKVGNIERVTVAIERPE